MTPEPRHHSAPRESAAPDRRQQVLTRLLGDGATLDDASSLGLADLVALECRVAGVLVEMSARGVAVDVPLARQLLDRWTREVAEIDRRYPDVNLRSVPQVRALLAGHGVDVPDTKRETLEPYAHVTVVADFLARRRASHAAGFVRQLVEKADAAGRVHPNYDGLGAVTGRIKASAPPLQSIPKRGETGHEIRRAIVGGPGRVLVAADYSQVELRVLAGLSGETTLLDAFEADEDVHEQVAAECGVDRQTAKAISFGIIYGQGPGGLARTLGCESPTAARYQRQYFTRYPRVKAYLDHVEHAAASCGAVWTRLGRCRVLPDALGRGGARKDALRQARSHVIQGTAADVYKRALVGVAGALPADCHLVLTIHDEVVVEAPESRAEEVAAVLRREMEGVADIGVHLAVTVNSGETLADAK